MLLSNPVRLREKHRALTVDVFSRLINKSPMCRAYSGAFDRAMIDGRILLPRDINIEADAQEYTLNWPSRLDRRNAEIYAYCTVDSDSRYVFGLHANFDPTVDPFEINQQAAEEGEFDLPEASRNHGRYWLAPLCQHN